MGTFLRSVQLHLAGTTATDARSAVADTLRKFVLEGPFVEVQGEDDRGPDRTILLGPAGDRPWLTVLDSEGNERELAKRLSALTGGAAVIINLVDSDLVHLGLYRAGDPVDEYCNAPDHYEDYGSDPMWYADWRALNRTRLKAYTRGHLDRWRDLLIQGSNEKQLRSVWNSKPVFADDILWATANALGMNADEIASTGDTRGFARLAFRRSEPAPYEIKAEGPPRLRLSTYTDPTRVYVGDELNLSISLQNGGGAGTGVDVVAWGTTLDNGLVQLASTRALDAQNPDGLKVNFEQAEGKIDDRPTRGRRARFGALPIPQGIGDVWQAAGQRRADLIKLYRASLETELHFEVVGSISAAGTGELFIAFIPHANRTEGAAVYQASLQVQPTPRRPLRARETQRPVASSTLESLQTRNQLFALVALDADPAQAAALTADIIHAWAGKAAQSLTTHLRTRQDLLPDKRRLASRKLTDSAYWQALERALETCVSFSIESTSACLVYDVDKVFYEASPEEPLPQLGIFYTATNAGDDERKSLEKGLVETVDRLMVRGAVAQAMVGYWDCGQPSPQLNTTLYEAATGVNGMCTTARFWCKRYLRGVTEKIWLGPELMAQLGTTDELARIARVTSVGHGVRVFLDEQAALDELEAALAPILPSEKDWREGVERLHPRK